MLNHHLTCAIAKNSLASLPPFDKRVSFKLVSRSLFARSYLFFTNAKIIGKCLFRAGPNISLVILRFSMAAKYTALDCDLRHLCNKDMF